ncbi:hypothetical protein [Nostocoides veronense]|uniref:Uncharacterized protein n=1 Tax=Nostocoides veronense TaxID=330836 RepID=A0ABP4XPR3_9MICO
MKVAVGPAARVVPEALVKYAVPAGAEAQVGAVVPLKSEASR